MLTCAEAQGQCWDSSALLLHLVFFFKIYFIRTRASVYLSVYMIVYPWRAEEDATSCGAGVTYRQFELPDFVPEKNSSYS